MRYVVVGDVVLLTSWDCLDDSDSWILKCKRQGRLDTHRLQVHPWLEEPPDRLKALAEAARLPRNGTNNLVVNWCAPS